MVPGSEPRQSDLILADCLLVGHRCSLILEEAANPECAKDYTLSISDDMDIRCHKSNASKTTDLLSSLRAFATAISFGVIVFLAWRLAVVVAATQIM